MKISFDLDGTICDSDWGWLDRIRDRGWKEEEEEKYYSSRTKVLDPSQFLARDDEMIILTGRPLHLENVTKLWLQKNGLGNVQVVFTRAIKEKPTATRKEFQKLGEMKAKLLIDMGVEVHFDDNEQVVWALRKCAKGKVKVVQVGSHIKW